MPKQSVAVFDSWLGISTLHPAWDRLVLRSGAEHPFSTFEWLDLWYGAYCSEKKARIIVLTAADEALAFLPGLLSQRWLFGIPLNCFCNAANGHTPRAAIVTAEEDLASACAALKAVWTALPASVDLAVINSVQAGSLLERAVLEQVDPFKQIHVEHTYDSPAFDLTDGWTNYLGSRSKAFRRRLRHTAAVAEGLGGLRFECSVPKGPGDLLVRRLERLDRKTWQHQNGSGLFSTPQNSAFYGGLLRRQPEELETQVAFLTIGGIDAAYEIAVRRGRMAFFLKYGYVPEFGRCSPGAQIQQALAQHMLSLGVTEIDLVGETTPEKARWQTHSRRHSNYWIINRRTVRGKVLSLMLHAADALRGRSLTGSRDPADHCI